MYTNPCIHASTYISVYLKRARIHTQIPTKNHNQAIFITFIITSQKPNSHHLQFNEKFAQS